MPIAPTAGTPRGQKQIRRVPIIHVYGQIAPVKLHDNNQQGLPTYGLAYGKDIPHLSEVNFLDDMRYLYVVRENRANAQLEKARKAISGAERIFFLGFGYAGENLDALGFPGVLKPHHHVYGTAKDYTPTEIRKKESYFAQGFVECGIQRNPWDKVTIYDCDCVRLLGDHI